jgi:acetylornithine deacetylase/succinyl-diaminopimelate desuccinylase-like protein
MLTRSSPSTKRVLDRLDRLYALGGGRGANRVAGSDAEQEACALAAGWMADVDLEVTTDAFGNVIGRLPGSRPELPEVWSGSHLDSVPEGGKYDGALGVLAAIEAVAAVGPAARTLGVVAFRDEERGCIGSLELAKQVVLPGIYLELHVEQGPVLEAAGAPLGVVTGIVGSTRCEVVFEGSAGHAGTTPMAARDDALVAAAEYVLRVRAAAERIDGAVATVGRLEVEPGVANVIPDTVRLTVDARAPDEARLTLLLDELGLEPSVDLAPVKLDDSIQHILSEEIERVAPPALDLPSGAGHDAGVLAAAGVATGMLFVRSLNGGISHAPEELTSEDDIALAIEVLTAALRRLASWEGLAK